MCDYGKTEEQMLDVYGEWTPIVDSITLIPAISPDNSVINKKMLYKTHKLVESPCFCFFPFETMAISWNGKVTGCCSDYSFKMDLGDANITSLEQIWNNPKYHSWRRALVTNNNPIGSLCRGCEFWKVNFQPKEELLLNGKVIIKYGYLYRLIHRNWKKSFSVHFLFFDYSNFLKSFSHYK